MTLIIPSVSLHRSPSPLLQTRPFLLILLVLSSLRDRSRTRRFLTMTNSSTGDVQENDAASSVKRTACGLCRKRKLRCDGDRPICGTCKRLSHDCTYDEARKRSGPKRGYIKMLEARLRTYWSSIVMGFKESESNMYSIQNK